jgi:3-oxoacyl-[acyl-carrier-protein] synthase-3
MLLVGDTQGRFLNPDNRVTAPLFGDAGTATLLEKSPGAVMSFHWGSDGAKYESLIIPGGGAKLPPRREEGPDASFNAVIADARGNPWTLGDYGCLWMDGVGVFGFGVNVVPAHIKEHLTLVGLNPEDLDCLALHQANRLMLKTIAQKCRVPLEKTPIKTLSRYGNLGAASIPALLCDEFAGSDTPPAKIMLCGFGAGLSWASCLLSLEETLFAAPVTLEEAEFNRPYEDKATSVENWHKHFAEA